MAFDTRAALLAGTRQSHCVVYVEPVRQHRLVFNDTSDHQMIMCGSHGQACTSLSMHVTKHARHQ
jgi:hypothetical protein